MTDRQDMQSNDDYILNLWKAFCKSRIALAQEYQVTDAVLNKWANRLKNLTDTSQIISYIKENVTIDGHVLDDPF